MAADFAKEEVRVLERWKKEKTFEKTLKHTKGKKPFVFYEGPPTANGKPGIHHVLARAFKDVICRFKTMQGFFVERKAGWDTHGLPVELEVEKKLGLKSKKEIEAYGIARFNSECRKSAWTYKEEWERLTERMGFWLDLEHPYVTYSSEYIEKLWGIIKQTYEKKLLYQGYKVVPHCPRCQTSLSSHEVAQGYKKVKENSVYVKFELVDEPGTFVLTWTTTPWTLPGNVALAVGEKIEYVKTAKNEKGEQFILAKDRVGSVIGTGTAYSLKHGQPARILKGKELLGKKYKRLFDFVDLTPQPPSPRVERGAKGGEGEPSTKAYEIVGADFVTTDEGTGVVHTAVMYGEDDYALGKALGLPRKHTVNEDGTFNELVKPWQGKFVKDEETENAIIQYLKDNNKLFKEAQFEHDYPFCWRCDSPLLYYAKTSWFIKMSALRDKLLANNATINWIPEHIKDGRFGGWLEEVKDWAFSRERYWGTPLPIWECNEKHRLVVGSYEELQRHEKPRNTVFIMRHGEAETNVKDVLSSWPEPVERRLTKQGRADIERAANELQKKKIDLIISSPLLRAKETADILSQALFAPVEVDDNLREIGFGSFNGKTEAEYHGAFASELDRFTKSVDGTEPLLDVRNRAVAFLQSLNEKYEGKKILLVSHGDVIWQLQAALEGKDAKSSMSMELVEPGVYIELCLPTLPTDEQGEFNPHRPFIDSVTLTCPECGKTMARVKELCDVWFDSGSMPFAGGVAGYPADYIAEAIDQTRGWFYTLLAVATLLEREAPYKNVICLGHILDEKGQKMSKHIGNVVDPWSMIEKHGVDALRFHFFTMNAAGDVKLFKESDVADVNRKVFLILSNVVTFWEQFVKGKKAVKSEGLTMHALDAWLEVLTALTILNVTESLEHYDVTKAGRKLAAFVDELSTRYLRASRKRLQNDDEQASAAREVFTNALEAVVALLTPFTPFFSETLYARLGKTSSVHLAPWPAAHMEKKEEYETIHKQMQQVWEIIELGRSVREEAEVKIRQPLEQFIYAGAQLETSFEDVIKAELNVREVHAAQNAPTGAEWKTAVRSGLTVSLDTTITDDLLFEGWYRDIVRSVNDLRKTAGLKHSDAIALGYASSDEKANFVFERFRGRLLSDARATSVVASIPDTARQTTKLILGTSEVRLAIL